jgi:hypothetical protein
MKSQLEKLLSLLEMFWQKLLRDQFPTSLSLKIKSKDLVIKFLNQLKIALMEMLKEKLLD